MRWSQEVYRVCLKQRRGAMATVAEDANSDRSRLSPRACLVQRPLPSLFLFPYIFILSSYNVSIHAFNLVYLSNCPTAHSVEVCETNVTPASPVRRAHPLVARLLNVHQFGNILFGQVYNLRILFNPTGSDGLGDHYADYQPRTSPGRYARNIRTHRSGQGGWPAKR